jgi:hypothetical protein
MVWFICSASRVDVVKEVARHRTLDRRAIWDAPGTRNVDCNTGTVITGRSKAANNQITLRNCVYVSVRTAKRSHQQSAAAQAFGIANRGHRNIDCLSGFRKRRKVRMHGDGGNIF